MKVKNILAILFMLGIIVIAAAQSSPAKVERHGNTFSEVKAKTSEIVLTDYFYNTGGQNYQIYINKASGRCFINKISSRTGKTYRYYLPEPVSRQICRELGVIYKEKKIDK